MAAAAPTLAKANGLPGIINGIYIVIDANNNFIGEYIDLRVADNVIRKSCGVHAQPVKLYQHFDSIAGGFSGWYCKAEYKYGRIVRKDGTAYPLAQRAIHSSKRVTKAKPKPSMVAVRLG